MINVHLLWFVASSKCPDQERQHVHAAAAAPAVHSGLQHGRRHGSSERRRLSPPGTGTPLTDQDVSRPCDVTSDFCEQSII